MQTFDYLECQMDKMTVGEKRQKKNNNNIVDTKIDLLKKFST